jgi:TM2 domain-containing membrane protein YozV
MTMNEANTGITISHLFLGLLICIRTCIGFGQANICVFILFVETVILVIVLLSEGDIIAYRHRLGSTVRKCMHLEIETKV